MFPWIKWKPESWRLRASRKNLLREYQQKYQTAEKSGKSQDDLWRLLEERARHDRFIDEQMIAAETSYLYEIAYRLRVPAPNYTDKTLWEEGSSGPASRILTEMALSDFRTAVRDERNERWQYWELRLKVITALSTGLTGVVGALIGLIGLIAILHRN